MNILIAGSGGRIGKIITDSLRESEKYNLVLLDAKDTKNPVNILEGDIKPYFKEIDIVIHLAANPNPYIEKEEAKKNIEISERIIEACKKSKSIKKIINASSLNVYPYIEIFERGEKITSKTILSPNNRWGGKLWYGQAKIEVEKAFEKFCKDNNLSLINLRFGAVTKNDLPPRQPDGTVNAVDREIHLKHNDTIRIIKQSINLSGISSYVCVSKRDGFVDASINFPL